MPIMAIICTILLISLLNARAIPDHFRREHWNDTDIASYLTDGIFATQSSEGTSFIKEILKAVHTSQHPKDISKCETRRLLIVDEHGTTLEGLGSILKSLIVSLAVAFHSNRIIVWGIGLPWMYERTKDEWTSREKLRFGETMVDCSNADEYNGGPFNCYFEPISSCTLHEHITPEELVELGKNPYDDEARLLFAEGAQTTRRAIALYHPPMSLLQHILDTGHYSDYFKKSAKLKYSHFWTAALSAYIFRPHRSILETFQKRHAGMTSGPLWGLHVRHGDVKALRKMIPYKKVYDFFDFFSSARDFSHVVKQVPKFIHVSSDNPNVTSVSDFFEEFQNLPQGGCLLDSEGRQSVCNSVTQVQSVAVGRRSPLTRELVPTLSHYPLEHTTWYGEDDNVSSYVSPIIVRVNNSDRFRTDHGFPVAAAGACYVTDPATNSGMCAMPYEEVLRYEAMEEHRSTPTSTRMMTVLLDALEDIFLLSLSDVVIAQGSSHFSTLSVHLMWARTGCRDVTHSFLFLDMDSMIEGTTPCALLPGTNIQNDTFDATSSPGYMRWQIITNRFLSGLPFRTDIETGRVKVPYDPWEPARRISVVNGLPRMPRDMFEREASSWGERYTPPWPGSCPKGMPKGARRYEFVTGLINLGAEHHEEWHFNQALRCWRLAMNIVMKFGFGSSAEAKKLSQIAEVVQGNIGYLRNRLRAYVAYARVRLDALR